MPDSKDQLRRPTYDLAFPSGAVGRVDQDEEWCELFVGGRRRRIRFHDYGEIYDVPGLYEQLFYDHLKCTSPTVIRELLEQELERAGAEPEALTVLDIGAGNGMVGEELARMGASTIVGVDIIDEAAEATERDRPGVYDDYHVLDLTALSRPERRALSEPGFNALTTVAALGFGDMPPLALAEALNFVSTPGWVALTIKEDFLEGHDSSGFSRLVRHMVDGGVLKIRAQRRYRHRVSVTGDPLHYVAIVAEKHADVPLEWARDAG